MQTSNTTFELNDIFFIDEDRGFISGGSGENGILLKTNNGGELWEEVNFAGGGVSKIFFINENTAWIVSNGKLFKSKDSSSNWNEIISLGDNFIADIYFLNNSHGWAAAGYSILKTITGGNSWESIELDSFRPVYGIEMLDANKGYCYAQDRLLRTTNGWNDWEVITLSNVPLTYIHDIEINSDGLIIVAGTFSLLISEDFGDTWSDITPFTLPNNPAEYRSIFSFSDGEFFVVGSASGSDGYPGKMILKTSDLGDNFESTIFGEYWLNSIYFVNKQVGWTCGPGGAILKTTNGGITFTNEYNNPTKRYNLFQNYPNPFNPSTTLSFEIPKQTYVEISVYNVLGEKISEIVHDNLDAGRYEYKFDAAGLTSGVYYYFLKTDEYYESRKMILLK